LVDIYKLVERNKNGKGDEHVNVYKMTVRHKTGKTGSGIQKWQIDT
jgi:hypothetical protein